MKNSMKSLAMMQYLTDNFLTLDELALAANLPITELKQMIEYKLIPNYTYKINCSVTCDSYLLGAMSADDKDITFYHKTNLIWIERAKAILLNHDHQVASIIIHDQLKQKFKELFANYGKHIISFAEVYDEQKNLIENIFEKKFADLYEHWCGGTYGLCTKNPSDELFIFLKEAYQILLNKLTDSGSKINYSKEEKEQIHQAVIQYDLYVSSFSPIDYAISSRKKFIDNLANTL